MQTLFRHLKRHLVAWGLYPRSGLARFAVWVAGLYVVSESLSLIIPASSKWKSILAGWGGFFEFIFVACGIFLLFRWVRRKLLWRLRNRLIVTYVFIGVIPVVLILTMFGITGYLIGNQITTMMVQRDLLSE